MTGQEPESPELNQDKALAAADAMEDEQITSRRRQNRIR